MTSKAENPRAFPPTIDSALFINVEDCPAPCLYCLDELRRGVPENGICGHEHLLAARNEGDGK